MQVTMEKKPTEFCETSETSGSDNLSNFFKVLNILDDGSSSSCNSMGLPWNGFPARTQEVVPRYVAAIANRQPIHSQGIWTRLFSDNGAGGTSIGGSMSIGRTYYQQNGLTNQGNSPLVNEANFALRRGRDFLSEVGDRNCFVGALNQPDLSIVRSHIDFLQHYGFLTEVMGKELENLLQVKHPVITREVFEMVFPFIFALMNDQYGWRVFAALIRVCDSHQLELIVEKINLKPNLFLNVAVCGAGSEAVRRLIKELQKSPLISKVVNILSIAFFRVMILQPGIILQCLDVLQPKQTKLLYIQAMEYCLKLATNQRGCLSLNSFILHSKGYYKNKLLNLICSHAVYLSQDPLGNYVVKGVLKLQCPWITQGICYELKGHYVRLSMQKHGSHIVEACLNSTEMHYPINDLINSNHFLEVAKDRYGNYVIQEALRITKSANSPLYERLVQGLLVHSHALKSGYARNILKWIDN